MPSIPLHRPQFSEQEETYVLEAMRSGRLAGDGDFTARCHRWLEAELGAARALLTTSGTHALELAALLLDLQAGDEVILPSFTHPSSSNAFALRGARLKFVDIRPDTLNIDERQVERALGPRTRAIVVVHYGGAACEMEPILRMAANHGIAVVEDAAQAILSTYRGRSLGTLGTFGCLSFHATKNVSCGEGGALLVNDPRYARSAEVAREMGTNRTAQRRGEVDEYTWLARGSSYLPSELNAAVLFGQFAQASARRGERRVIWENDARALRPLEEAGRLRRVIPPSAPGTEHNAHVFAVLLESRSARDELLVRLRQSGIGAAFHFVPLHSSPAGRTYGDFVGEDRHTTDSSERLVRLPIWAGLTEGQQAFIVDSVASALNSAG